MLLSGTSNISSFKVQTITFICEWHKAGFRDANEFSISEKRIKTFFSIKTFVWRNWDNQVSAQLNLVLFGLSWTVDDKNQINLKFHLRTELRFCSEYSNSKLFEINWELRPLRHFFSDFTVSELSCFVFELWFLQYQNISIELTSSQSNWKLFVLVQRLFEMVKVNLKGPRWWHEGRVNSE